jgi:hypothetical protein
MKKLLLLLILVCTPAWANYKYNPFTDNEDYYQTGGASLSFANSIVNTSNTVTLVNDSATPGNSKYYGTNSGGTRGYFSLPAAGVTSVSNSNGTLTISPTTGAVVASLNLSNANTWTGSQSTDSNSYFSSPGAGTTGSEKFGSSTYIGGDYSTAVGYGQQIYGTASIGLGAGGTVTASNTAIFGSNLAPIYNVFFGNAVNTGINGSPADYTIHGVGASPADTAGANLILAGGIGKGTGVGGQLQFKVAPHGSSGSTPNSLVTAGYFDEQGNFYSNSDIHIAGKLYVSGGIDPVYIDFTDGSGQSTAASSHGRFIYNNTTHTMQMSVNGGGYVDVGTAGSGSPYGSNGDVQLYNGGNFYSVGSGFNYNLASNNLVIGNVIIQNNSTSNPQMEIVASSMGGDILRLDQYGGSPAYEFGSSGELRIYGSSGSTGYVLTSNGSGSAPSWQSSGGGLSLAGSSGDLQYNNGSGNLGATDNFNYNAASYTLTLYGQSFTSPGLTLYNNAGGLTQKVPTMYSSYNIIWPSSQGGSNTFLQNDGSGNLSWQSSGGGSPGGSNTYVQYNSSGSFAGDSYFAYTGNGALQLTYGGSNGFYTNPSSGVAAAGSYNNYYGVLASSYFAGYFTDSANSVTMANSSNAIESVGGVKMTGLARGSGPPGTILTNYTLYVDSLTGIVYCT